MRKYHNLQDIHLLLLLFRTSPFLFLCLPHSPL
nr:MAG TPA: hypothetical protein [Caudoviricetes sp.]